MVPFGHVYYAVFAFLGVVIASVGIIRFGYADYQRKEPRRYLHLREIKTALAASIIGALVGARIGYVAVYWSYYEHNLFSILYIWRGGLIYHGGLAGGFASCILISLIRGIPVLKLTDLSLPWVSLGYAVGRIGCLLNGCCAGIETQLPWGIAVHAGDALKRHPTQLYASIAGVLIFLLLKKHYRISKYVGSVTALFFLLHGIYRFTIDFLRIDEPVLLGLTAAQGISLAMIILGALLYFFLPKTRYQEE